MRRRLLIAVAVAVLALGLIAGWLLGSASGARFALERLAGWFAGELRVEQLEGRLLGPLRLQRLSWQADADRLQVEQIRLQWQPLALFRGRVLIEQLQADGIDWLPAADRPESAWALPRWQWPWLQPPLAVVLQRLQLDRLSHHGEPLLDRLDAQLQLAADGELQLQQLQIERADDRFRLQGGLPGTATLHWQHADRPPLSAALTVAADAVELEHAAAAGGWLRVRLGQQQWQASARLGPGDLPSALAWPEGLQVAAELTGQSQSAQLSARIEPAAGPGVALAAELLAEPGRLRLPSVRLQPDGGGELSGEASLDPTAMRWDARLTATALRWQPAAGPPLQFDGEWVGAGAGEHGELQIDGELARSDQRASVALAAQWQGGRWQLAPLRLSHQDGRLEIAGQVSTGDHGQADLDVRAEGFSWGWLGLSDPGRLDADARVQARREAAGTWNWQLEIDRLGGDWRGRALTGAGRLQQHQGGAPGGRLALQWGDAQLRAETDGDQLKLQLQRLDLAALDAQISGQLDGWVRLPPQWPPARAEFDLHWQRPGWQQHAVAELSVGGGYDLAADRELRLVLRGWRPWPDQAAADAVLALRGRPQHFQFELKAEQAERRLELAGAAQAAADSLQLQWHSGRLIDPSIASWQLSSTGPWQWQQGRLTALPTTCLEQLPTRLCAALADPAAPLQLQLQALQLQHWVPLLLPDLGWRPQGQLDAAVEFDLVHAAGWPLRGWLQLGAGELGARDRLVVDADPPPPLLRWQQLRLEFDPAELRLQADLAAGGSLDGHWQRPSASADALWDGRLQGRLQQLQVLELLAPDLIDADAELELDLHWQQQPWLAPRGSVELRQLRGKLPALGLRLADSAVSLRRDDGPWLLDGVIASGEGVLRLEGEWPGGGQGRLRLAGERVLVADTRSLRALLSPNLQLDWGPRQQTLQGRVEVLEARVDLERLEAGLQPADDVVVLDPATPQRRPEALAVAADLELRLGPAVQLRGFGFDGGIQGDLKLRQRPGRPASGRGVLELRGDYRAYGQQLSLERGRLLFSGGALDNPGIDLRAGRVVEAQKVGVDVKGAARQPRLNVWAEPPLQQAEALSYLILGRPLRSASSADGAQLGQAAATIGGNYLAAQVGNRLGLDTFGIADSGALGGAAFTVGKYLSPALYLSYGVGLFEPGSVVTLRYLLSQRFDLEIEAAQESRFGANYRWETD